MPRESAADKAARYLLEGRLTIVSCTGTSVYAVVKGDGEQYLCGYAEGPGRWVCSCPVRHDRCSHLIALRLVAVRNPRPVALPSTGRVSRGKTPRSPEGADLAAP